MMIREILDGSESEEEEEWERVEGSESDEAEEWEEVGGSSSGDAVGDAVFPGGGAPGDATGHGGGQGTRPGDGEAKSHGGGQGTRPGDGDATRRGDGEVTRHGGGGEVAGRGGGGWFGRAKRLLVAGGARVLLYPTVACNVPRNKFQAGFHWWDRIDEHVVLGAVPFRKDIRRLKKLGVTAVVTLTEPFETMIKKSEYQAHGMDHLEIPTPDYSAAPSIDDIHSALHFMHRIASRGHSTYVHCKAGRGRSTTVVLCYLIRYRSMSHQEAWNHTRSIRPRVALTSAQHEAVTQFDKLLQVSQQAASQVD